MIRSTSIITLEINVDQAAMKAEALGGCAGLGHSSME
jgi:hypothetical protein